MKTWQDYPIKKDANNNYYIAYLLNGQYVSDYHVIPNDPMGAYNYDEIATFYVSLTGAEMVYNVEGDLVVQKQVVPGPTLDELKARKLTAADNWTADKITGGFISECTGSPVRYDSDRDTQNTVSSDLNTIYLSPEKFNENFPNGYPMRGYPENENIKKVYFLTKEQLLQWNVDLGLHRGTCKQAGWSKQSEVNAAQNKEELDAIILD